MKFKLRKYILFYTLLLLQTITFAQSGIYVGGHFRRDSLVTVPTLKNSGFTYVILFNVQVESNGDLTMDNVKICSNGEYVFASRHPNYIKDVTNLRTGQSSVMRIEKCIGGWGSKSYDNIKALVKAQGTGETSILYKNFKALKTTIPVVEAINNDDEQTYDVETASAFHIMLYDLGYKTTVAPYTNKTFWQNFVTRVNNARPGAVDRIDLQCYDGGAGNRSNPNAWAMGNIPLHAGLLNSENSGSVNAQMMSWKKNSSVVGGFIWVYNDNSFSLQNYSRAICSVFGGGEVVFVSKMKPQVVVYPQVNFEGEGVTFETGRFSKYAINAQKFRSSDLASVKVHEGFTMEVFDGDSLKGNSLLLNTDVDNFRNISSLSVKSWKVLNNGDKNQNGKIYYLRNLKTGTYLSLESDAYTDGIYLVQKPYTGSESQKWQFNHLYFGTYNVINQFSKKIIQVNNGSVEEGAFFEQSINKQTSDQRLILIKTSTQDVYKLLSESSVKYIASNTSSNSTKVIQTEGGNTEASYWKLEESVLSGISISQNNTVVVYPNPAVNQLFISEDIHNISSVMISDIQGRQLYNGVCINNTVDVSRLKRGIYLIQIFTADSNQPIINKFVKR